MKFAEALRQWWAKSRAEKRIGATDFFWPTLEPLTPEETAEDEEALANDNAAIVATGWTHNIQLAVEEARRLEDSEDDRVKTVEGKATTYILFAGAITPLLTYLESFAWDAKLGNAPSWISAVVILVAVAYLIGGVVWAFRAVRVDEFHRVGISELAIAWQGLDPGRTLVRKILKLARANRLAINDKVSSIKMAQFFMRRAIVAFGLLLIIEASWQIGSSAHDYLWPAPKMETTQVTATDAALIAELTMALHAKPLADFERCMRRLAAWSSPVAERQTDHDLRCRDGHEFVAIQRSH